MKILVYGAGAIGGSVGGFMVKSGKDVILVDKVKEHVGRMNSHGLSFTGFGGDETIPVKAILPKQIIGPLELVFLAVKSQDTEAALDVLMPNLGHQSIVVSLQNGINPPRIASRIGGDRTVGAFVSFSTNYYGPGLIFRGNEGEVYVGELDGSITNRLNMIRDLLSSVCQAFITNNIYGYLWSKLAWLCQATIGAMVDATKYEIITNEKYKDLLVEAVLECVNVAKAEGIRLESYTKFDIRPFLQGSTKSKKVMYQALCDSAMKDLGNLKTKTGILRDLAVRKRKTEIPWLSGYVVERGKALGIPTPINELATKIISELEESIRPLGWDNLDELNELVKNK